MTKILLIDDDEDQLQLVRNILKKEGFEVMALSDPSLMIRTISKNNPDIVLCDIRLRLYDGRELCRELKDSNQKLPVILYSGYHDLEESAYDFGADDFIPKPFKPEILLNVIYRHLQQEGWSNTF